MILSTLSISDEIYLDEERDANITTTPGIVIIMWSLAQQKLKCYIWREFSLAFAQLYPIGGHYYWRSIGTEFLSLHLLFLPLEVLPKGCHH